MKSIDCRRRTDVSLALILVGALFLNGCHTNTRVAVPDATPPAPDAAVFAELTPGDNDRLTLRSGETVRFVFSEARTDGLVGQDGRHVPYGDVAQLEKRQLSRSKTIWLTVGIAGGFGLLLLISYGMAVAELAGAM